MQIWNKYRCLNHFFGSEAWGEDCWEANTAELDNADLLEVAIDVEATAVIGGRATERISFFCFSASTSSFLQFKFSKLQHTTKDSFNSKRKKENLKRTLTILLDNRALWLESTPLRYTFFSHTLHGWRLRPEHPSVKELHNFFYLEWNRPFRMAHRWSFKVLG